MAEDPSTILASVPGLAPPPGVVPNFVNPYSLESIQIVSAVLCLALALLSTLLRMYTKLFIIKTHGWEDCKLLSAWLGRALLCNGTVATHFTPERTTKFVLVVGH